jgi:hypothetical protein
LPDAKVSITFKAGQPQDPWIVFHGESVAESAAMIQQAAQIGMFPKVREVAQQFADGQVTTAQAVQTIQTAMPGAQVITPPEDPWANTPASPPQQYAPPGGYAAGAQPNYQQQTPPTQQLPASQVVLCQAPGCGQPMQFKQGTSQAGKPYKGHFCAVKNHAPVWG